MPYKHAYYDWRLILIHELDDSRVKGEDQYIASAIKLIWRFNWEATILADA